MNVFFIDGINMIIINEITILGMHPYSFFSGCAFFIGFVMLVHLLKRHYYEYMALPKLILWEISAVVFSGIIMGYIIEVIKYFFITGKPKLMGFEGVGFVAYGGIIGSLITALIFIRHFNLDGYIVFDALSCTIPIIHGIARIGCLFAGCCYGIEYYGFMNIYYPKLNLHCFPTQIIEACLNITLGAILIYLNKRKTFSGRIVYYYLGIYSVYRFILEFFRGDELRGVFGMLSASQYISILVFIFSIINIIVFKRKLIRFNAK